MPVCTKGFVITHVKDPFFIAYRVQHAIDTLIRQSAPTDIPIRNQANYEFVKTELATMTGSGMTFADFKFDGDARRMTIHYFCDCDHIDHAPHTISLSIGCHGASELLLKTALHSLSCLGDIYYQYSDLSDSGYEKLPTTPSTYLTECAAGTERASPRTLAMWHHTELLYGTSAAHMAGQRSGPRTSLRRDEIEQILTLDYHSAVAAIEARAGVSETA
jgi:hypothetical protein